MTLPAARRPNEALLEARALSFGYDPALPVVSGVNVFLRPKSLTGLIGANGCGKSTLLRLLSGVLRATRGQVIFSGESIDLIPPRRLATRLAYVPHSTRSVFPFTALEVVLTGRSPYTPRFHFESERDLAIAREALATVEALHLAGRPVTELSGGEGQMVAVARALAQEPELLLMDEPSASLDLKHRARLIRTLSRLRDERGLTALVVTHDLQLLEPAFDRVIAMRLGRLAAEGEPDVVLRETVLREVYDDKHARARRMDGRVFVWSES